MLVNTNRGEESMNNYCTERSQGGERVEGVGIKRVNYPLRRGTGFEIILSAHCKVGRGELNAEQRVRVRIRG